jgi:hypothetical protein
MRKRRLSSSTHPLLSRMGLAGLEKHAMEWGEPLLTRPSYPKADLFPSPSSDRLPFDDPCARSRRCGMARDVRLELHQDARRPRATRHPCTSSPSLPECRTDLFLPLSSRSSARRRVLGLVCSPPLPFNEPILTLSSQS